MSGWTADDVAREVSGAASDAARMVARAARVVGVPREGALTPSQLLLLLEALGGEGGEVQVLAEALAARALRRQQLLRHGSPGPRVA